MYIRLKQANGEEVNVIACNVLAFEPQAAGSKVTMVGGTTFSVVESNRAIRTQFKKLNGNREQEVSISGSATADTTAA